MTTTPRFDRTLRAVMWSDAFLSVAIVLVVTSVLLALFGAVTAVCLMLRMSDGDYGLPERMRVPLPYWLRPAPLRSAWTRG